MLFVFSKSEAILFQIFHSEKKSLKKILQKIFILKNIPQGKIHHEEEINDFIKEKNDDRNSEILNESIETRRKVSQRKKLL